MGGGGGLVLNGTTPEPAPRQRGKTADEGFAVPDSGSVFVRGRLAFTRISISSTNAATLHKRHRNFARCCN